MDTQDTELKPRCKFCGNTGTICTMVEVARDCPAYKGKSAVRQFNTGATRDLDADKIDFEGFLSPLALRSFGEYMHKHRKTAAGLRDSDNWQKGIPMDAYMKSMWRHFFELWTLHRAGAVPDDRQMEEALNGVLFNAQGYLHEVLKNRIA